MLRTIAAYSTRVAELRLWPDGSRFVSRGESGPSPSVPPHADGTPGWAPRPLIVWDAAIGAPLRRLGPTAEDVIALDLHPDGRRLIAVAGSGETRVWDSVDGRQLLNVNTLDGRRQVTAVRFSPDGTRFAVGVSTYMDREGAEVRVHETATGRRVASLTGMVGIIHQIAFHPAGHRIATSDQSGAVIRIWDANTGEQLLQLNPSIEFIQDLAFGADGRHLFARYPDQVITFDGTPLPAVTAQ